jgi:hypothetical protein
MQRGESSTEQSSFPLRLQHRRPRKPACPVGSPAPHWRLSKPSDLSVRKRRKVKRATGERKPLRPSVRVNDTWSTDFVNGYIEGFNGKIREECLNEHWFETLPQARREVVRWRRD